MGPRELLPLRLAAGSGHKSIEPCPNIEEGSQATTSAICHVRAKSKQIAALTIRSSRDRFAAAELALRLSHRRGRKALRLNSGVSPHETDPRYLLHSSRKLRV